MNTVYTMTFEYTHIERRLHADLAKQIYQSPTTRFCLLCRKTLYPQGGGNLNYVSIIGFAKIIVVVEFIGKLKCNAGFGCDEDAI